MQKLLYLTIVALLFATGKISAQEVSDSVMSDVIEIMPESDTLSVIEGEEYEEIEIPRELQWEKSRGWKTPHIPDFGSHNKGHWAGIGIGYNGLISGIDNFSLPEGADYLTLRSRSVSVAINPIDYNIVTKRDWALVTGFGFEINNFYFANGNTIKSVNGGIAPDFSHSEGGMNVLRSKLVTSYINVPLLVEFRLGYSGYVSVGAIGGWRLSGRTKLVGLEGNSRTRIKQRDQLHLRDFHYGATFTIGYRHSALNVKYYPHSIFKSNQGPEVQQINIGYMLML